MVTGTVSMDTLNLVYENLKNHFPQNSYSLCIGENPVYNENSMLKLKECSVLLVESLEQSEKKEINKLAELIDVSKAKVVGAVVI